VKGVQEQDMPGGALIVRVTPIGHLCGHCAVTRQDDWGLCSQGLSDRDTVGTETAGRLAVADKTYAETRYADIAVAGLSTIW